MSKQRFVAIGRIGRPQGIKGDVRISSGGDVSRGLEGYTRFFVGRPGVGPDVEEPRPIEIERHRPQGRFLVVKFAGLGTPEEARTLLHWVLYVDRREMPPVAEDEYYYADLLGCRVIDEAGEELGRVADVFGTAAHDVLVVASPDGEWMIPVVSEHVVSWDFETGEVHVRRVGGLRG
ncbi:MAG: 16S rRNA processing protein RimM [Deltaproteobacteria bacterium]|nr:16S rRNA processing protein RimM [Deltaproteobacteria bacterium]